jgi:hypothetical protein
VVPRGVGTRRHLCIQWSKEGPCDTLLTLGLLVTHDAPQRSLDVSLLRAVGVSVMLEEQFVDEPDSVDIFSAETFLDVTNAACTARCRHKTHGSIEENFDASLGYKLLH